MRLLRGLFAALFDVAEHERFNGVCSGPVIQASCPLEIFIKRHRKLERKGLSWHIVAIIYRFFIMTGFAHSSEIREKRQSSKLNWSGVINLQMAFGSTFNTSIPVSLQDAFSEAVP